MMIGSSNFSLIEEAIVRSMLEETTKAEFEFAWTQVSQGI